MSHLLQQHKTDDNKTRMNNKPAGKSIDKLPFNDLAKQSLKVSIVNANAFFKMNEKV